MDHPSCDTGRAGPASQAMRGCSCAEVVFWHARCWPDSVRHVRARATVSHWHDQYHHVL